MAFYISAYKREKASRKSKRVEHLSAMELNGMGGTMNVTRHPAD